MAIDSRISSLFNISIVLDLSLAPPRPHFVTCEQFSMLSTTYDSHSSPFLGICFPGGPLGQKCSTHNDLWDHYEALCYVILVTTVHIYCIAPTDQRSMSTENMWEYAALTAGAGKGITNTSIFQSVKWNLGLGLGLGRLMTLGLNMDIQCDV